MAMRVKEERASERRPVIGQIRTLCSARKRAHFSLVFLHERV